MDFVWAAKTKHKNVPKEKKMEKERNLFQSLRTELLKKKTQGEILACMKSVTKLPPLHKPFVF